MFAWFRCVHKFCGNDFPRAALEECSFYGIRATVPGEILFYFFSVQGTVQKSDLSTFRWNLIWRITVIITHFWVPFFDINSSKVLVSIVRNGVRFGNEHGYPHRTQAHGGEQYNWTENDCNFEATTVILKLHTTLETTVILKLCAKLLHTSVPRFTPSIENYHEK